MQNSFKLKVIGKCPKCGKDVVENEKSFYCCGYRDSLSPCNFSIWKNDKFFEWKGKKVTASIAKSLLSKGRVSLKGLISQRGSEYDAVVKADFSGKYPKFELDFS